MLRRLRPRAQKMALLAHQTKLVITEGPLEGETMVYTGKNSEERPIFVLIDQDGVRHRHPGCDPNGARRACGTLFEGGAKEAEALARGGLSCDNCGKKQGEWDGYVTIELAHMECDSKKENCPLHRAAKTGRGAVKKSKVGQELRDKDRCQCLCITCDRRKTAAAARAASCCWLIFD